MSLCSLGMYGCPVDDRTLDKRAGLVFLTGGGGDSLGFAGGGMGGDGAEAGYVDDGQSGAPTGGSVSMDAGSPGSGGSEPAGHGGVGGSSGAGVASGNGGMGLGGASGGSAGSAGSAGAGGHLVGRCPDLDANFVFDCDETIAKNYAFDQDTSDWSTDTNLVLDWQRLDAEGHSDSGSLSVEDTLTTDSDGTLMVGARQCIPVNARTTYSFAVQISVPDGATDTTAGFELIIYNDDDCLGSMVDIAYSPPVRGSSWSVAQLSRPMPQFAKSLVMRLVSIKPFREAPSGVLFDNVLVHPVN